MNKIYDISEDTESIRIMIFKLFGNNSNDSNYEKKFALMIDELKEYTWGDFESVKQLIQPAVEVVIYKNNKVKIGTSKLGGTPDLSVSFDWPKYKEEPMVFIGQLNLKELKSFHKNEILPQKGILYFFAYFPKPVNEFGAEYEFRPQRDSYEVFYYAGEPSQLRSSEFPKDLTAAYQFQSY